MQWLIDILAAKVIAEIGVPPTFIDRGDKAAYDWLTAFFTKDGAWHTLDLSAIIPTNTTGVLLTCEAQTVLISQILLLRPRATSGLSNFSGIVTQIANVPQKFDFSLAIGDNRTIEYFATPVAWPVLSLGVKGWWL